jgi:hypothetical protein
MPKDKKKKLVKKERPDKYDEKLSVSGSFLDVMKAAGKDANTKSAQKKA